MMLCFSCAVTVADYLNHLALRFAPSDVQLDLHGSKYNPSELLAELGDFDKARPIAIETGTEGCFIRDSVSDQRLFQVVWSPDREGWLLSDHDVKAHYFVTRSFYLASLCGSVNTSLDSELFDALPDAGLGADHDHAVEPERLVRAAGGGQPGDRQPGEPGPRAGQVDVPGGIRSHRVRDAR